jgi:hypothetical protein
MKLTICCHSDNFFRQTRGLTLIKGGFRMSNWKTEKEVGIHETHFARLIRRAWFRGDVAWHFIHNEDKVRLGKFLLETIAGNGKVRRSVK